jgi:isoprenylcysteine carboxyl methyltransferase (ICMT) family protein YpbQ
MEIIFPNDRKKKRMLFSTQLFNFLLEFLARSIKKEKECIEIGRGFKYGKKNSKYL